MQPLCIHCAGRFFTLFMRIRKSGAEFPLRHRFAYIFTLFFSIKSTFPIMGIYHSHRLQNEYIITLPTNFIPRFFKSADILSDHSLVVLSHSYNISPSVNLQRIIIKARLLLHNIPKYSCIRNTRPNFQLISAQ